MPASKIISEIAEKLGLDEARLQKAAAETRLAHKVRHYYRSPSATRLGRLAEKIGRYRAEGVKEAKILRMIGKLEDKEREQLLSYLKFLQQQCRRRTKEKKS